MLLSSVTVLVAFLAFLMFGYLSLVRILYRSHFDVSGKTSLSGASGVRALKQIGGSAFFVSLPATSILMFWGWGPTLLWLLVFHLLADSLVNLQVTAYRHDRALSEYLITTDNTSTALLMRALIQFYLVLILAVAVTLLTKIIETESGLLFALASMVPAWLLLQRSKLALPKILIAVIITALLALGLILGSKLGFSIYGEWAPFDTPLDWLKFNNSTVLALMVVMTCIGLANSQVLSNDLAKLAGIILLLLAACMLAKLLWLNPALDAPLNIAATPEAELVTNSSSFTPLFISLCMFQFAGMTTLFFRVFNSTAPSDSDLPAAANFGTVQAESLLQLILIALVVLSLASALGIGAWNTHYLNWSDKIDLVDHMTLALKSISTLVYINTTSGNIGFTIIMWALCLAGLSFLGVCVKALSLADDTLDNNNQQPSASVLKTIYRSKLPQFIAAFLLSCFFLERGLSWQVWLLIGMLSWLIVMQLITSMTINLSTDNFARVVFGGQSLLLIGIGIIQITWTSSVWIINGDALFAAAAVGILVLALALLWRPIRIIATTHFRSEDTNLF